VVVANLPARAVLTVKYPDGTSRELTDDLVEGPLVVVVPGDRDALGWGAYVVHYGATRQIRNGHNRFDRPVWHEAEKAVRHGGIAYVQHEQRDYYGRSRWFAVGVRIETDRTGVYVDDGLCGDCMFGRCHWGSDASRERAEARGERCGCERHAVSVEAARDDRRSDVPPLP
jgi:hypothetical protein